MEQHSVFIVDDHPMVRRGLADLIRNEDDLDVCGEADGPSDALPAIEQMRPDLVMVDLKLREGTGLDLIKQIRSRFKDMKLLVCSVYEESAFAERVIRAGATGYVCKNESGEKILQAIREVLAGRLYISGEMKDQILYRVFKGGEDQTEDPVQRLSDREAQVFEMIGEGMSVRQIAERLNLSPKTIETYQEGIKTKLGIESSRDIIRRSMQWQMDGT